ncbi:MAG: CRISPR-associated endonuclease Cas1, partial [Deltaproteobacteria bacterium]|nr:CRISPR-associated endonuclease Cas1 [Deltaproteobacteria bacterium]
MATIYVSEQGAVISKTSRRLIVSKDSAVILELPVFKIERIFIFGNIQITTQAMNFLLENNIDVSFFTMGGKCHGRLTAMESKNIFLRLAQYERYLDKEFQINLARTIVTIKLDNEIGLIYSFAKNYGISKFKETLVAIQKCKELLKSKTAIKSVMGIEGIAASYFFKAFKMMIRNEDLIFNVRQKNPSLDPINSLLSFGYTLVTNEILSVLTGQGFDPYIGFLHGINYGRPSLALDIVEEFRSDIDGFTLKLLNKAILTEDDFISTPDGTFLKPDSMKKYFIHYDKLMSDLDSDSESIAQSRSHSKSKRLYIKDRVNVLRKAVIYKAGYI